MKRWVWKVLLMAAAVAALTVGASAKEYDSNVVAADPDQVEIDGAVYDLQQKKVIGYTDNLTERLVIVGSIQGTTIEAIDNQAFINCTKTLKEVIIPVSIGTVGDSAFDGCAELKTVVFLEAASPITDPEKTTGKIGKRAFAACGLETLVLAAGLNTIGEDAFVSNNNLKAVVIPDGVATLGTGAFSLCERLEAVYIPNSIKDGTIDSSAFAKAPIKVIHYGGDSKDACKSEFEDKILPNGLSSDDIHYNKVQYKRYFPNLTCEQGGSITGGVICLTPSDDGNCDLLYPEGGIKIDPLGHSYPEPKPFDVDEEFDACTGWTGTLTLTCVRCEKNTKTVTVTFPGTGHVWDLAKEDFPENFDPKNLEDLDEEQNGFKGKYEKKAAEIESVESTCAEAGYLTWTPKCTICGEEGGPERYDLQPLPEGEHTFTPGTPKDDDPIAANCLSQGVEVTRLFCDCGEKEYYNGGDGCSECERLLGIIKAIENGEEEPEETPEEEDEGDASGSSEKTTEQKRADAIAEYVDHLMAEHDPKDDSDPEVDITSPIKYKISDQTGHTWTSEGYRVEKEATCTQEGMRQKIQICSVCGAEGEPIGESEASKPLGHLWDKSEGSGYSEDIDQPNPCTEPGTKTITGRCLRDDCDGDPSGGPFTVVEDLPVVGHKWVDLEDYVNPDDKAATCTEPGQSTTGAHQCTVCGMIEVTAQDILPALGHDWDFEPDGGVMPPQAEDCSDTPVTGTATCKRCGERSDHLEITIPGKLDHTWEWVPNADGKTETQICKNCEKQGETRTISNSGGAGDDNTGGDGKDDDDKKDDENNSGTATPSDTAYRVDVIQASNGTVSVSRSSATAGTSVTLTISAGSGYELDMLRVTTSTSAVNTTSLGGGEYRFTMPAADVEVRATFARKAASSSWTGSSSSSSSSSSSQSTAQSAVQSVPKLNATGQIFPDIPVSHWAAGEINWANQMGYMNGTANGFNPNGNITFQQMWMVMARLTGSNPSSMADARRWAVNGGFADGSAPEGSVTRQQLVTALYRCAHLMGTSNRNTTTLAGFPDSRTVSSVAREPFAWAVANGIIGGNANGRLDPNGTLTRAQFAVILYRFSQRV